MDSVDQELMLNRVVDKCGEIVRDKMDGTMRHKFDRLTPEARRDLVIYWINKGVLSWV